MRHWDWYLGLLLVISISVTTGCGGGSTANPKAKSGETTAKDKEEVSDLSGEVTIDGSSTVQPLSTAAAEGFLKIHPQVKVPVATSGTGGGFKKFVKGELDISNASRPITTEEVAQCKTHGVEFVEVPVAYDGLTIVVNPANDWCNELTVDQIKKIYLETGAAKTWKEVNPEWPDEPLKIFSPGTDSGTFDYFREVIGGKKVNIRPDLQTSEDDNVLVQGVEGEKGAIGYFGAAYYAGAGGKLKAVKIINPKTNKAVEATEANVISGDYYPYSRPLFIYVNLKSIDRPEVRMYVEHYLENAPAYAKKVGYFPLPEAVYTLVKTHVDESQPGTCFVTADGKAREGSFLDVFKTENLTSTK